MHNFEVHSNESMCRKSGLLGLEQVRYCLDEENPYTVLPTYLDLNKF